MSLWESHTQNVWKQKVLQQGESINIEQYSGLMILLSPFLNKNENIKGNRQLCTFCES